MIPLTNRLRAIRAFAGLTAGELAERIATRGYGKRQIYGREQAERERSARCESCIEELARALRHELEGEALAVMEDLGFEMVTHNERDEACFSCSLSRMLDRLAAASHGPSKVARMLAAVRKAVRL